MDKPISFAVKWPVGLSPAASAEYQLEMGSAVTTRLLAGPF